MKKILLTMLACTCLSSNAYADDSALLKRAKAAVKEQLNDADSAKFRNLKVRNGDKGKIVCGEVNAKNRFGGYVGFQHFIAIGNSAAVFDREGDEAAIELGQRPVWESKCQ